MLTKWKIISTSLTFDLGALCFFFENFGYTFFGGTQKQPPGENPNMGLKTTLQTPFHEAGKGQKRALFWDRSIVTGCTVRNFFEQLHNNACHMIVSLKEIYTSRPFMRDHGFPHASSCHEPRQSHIFC